MINSCGYSKQLSKVPETCFQINLMRLGVWRVVLGLKLDARSSLERSWAPVMQKVMKMTPKWSPRDAFGSTLGLCRATSGMVWTSPCGL